MPEFSFQELFPLSEDDTEYRPLTTDHVGTAKFNGADVLTGARVAELWAEHLGRDVSYAGDDLDAWAEQAKQMMPEWMVADLKIMYAHFQKEGLVASQEDLAQQAKILGRPPRSFESYVKETAVGWSAE